MAVMFPENRQILEEIISEIQSVSSECKWFLSSERLTEILRIRKEEYYRLVYQRKYSRLNYDVARGFSESTGDILCGFLSTHLNIENTEMDFLKGGIFFDEKFLLEIRDYFISFLYSILEGHRLDRELLMLLASATIEFDDAFESYFDDKFDLDVLAGRCAAYYIEMKSINTTFGADFFLKDYLLNQVKYNKIRLSEITLEFRSRAYYDLFGEEQQKHSVKRKLAPELKELLKFFKLQETATRSDLKKRFKELLKIYHPDINKEGLEKTKIIIMNYKRLSAILK